MRTKLLRKNLEVAIENLMPYFKITEDELAEFKKPKLVRGLTLPELIWHNEAIPGYVPSINTFYFPKKNFLGGRDIFSQATMHHEAGHYVHFSLNPSIYLISLPLRDSKQYEDRRKLLELVAEYGNFILGLRDFDRFSGYKCYLNMKLVYDKQGPEFLPRLARMTLEEATKEGIIEFLYSA